MSGLKCQIKSLKMAGWRTNNRTSTCGFRTTARSRSMKSAICAAYFSGAQGSDGLGGLLSKRLFRGIRF